MSLVWRDWGEAVCVLSAVELPGVLLEVEVPAESLVADLAGERLLLVVRVHVEGQVVDLKQGEINTAQWLRMKTFIFLSRNFFLR